MAARPGEEIVATLLADVHYYYGPPTAKLPHHRFDKGSYVYLYEDQTHRRARLEIANKAGTPDQDAFNGFLDNSHVDYSYKHTNLVTVTAGSISSTQHGNPTQNDANQWHLPTYDPHNENKYNYRLHTVDIYFWTEEDALDYVNAARRVLLTSQLTILDEPAPPSAHNSAMSSVVQNLEHAAINVSSYHHGQRIDPHKPVGVTSAFPGPPTSAAQSQRDPTPPAASATPSFAPMAYNPAAPAAPETIRYREKTPPPEDSGANPLTVAASTDHGQTFSSNSAYAQPQQGSYFPGPPQQPPPHNPSLHSPYPNTQPAIQHVNSFPAQPAQAQNTSSFSPQPQHLQHTNSFPIQSHFNRSGSSLTSPPVQSSTPSKSYQQTGFAPPPPAQAQNSHAVQYANYPGSPGFPPSALSPSFAPPPQSGQHSIVSPLSTTSPPQQAPYSPPPPPNGYSTYQYTPGSTPAVPVGQEHSVHHQLYRPTEGEHMGHVKRKEPWGKLEERAARVEKGVGVFLKKLENKYG